MRSHYELPSISLEVPKVESVDPPRPGPSCQMYGIQLCDDSLAHSLFDKGAEANHELEATEEVQDVHAEGRGFINLGVLFGAVSYVVGAEALLEDKVVHLINDDSGALEDLLRHFEELLDEVRLGSCHMRDLFLTGSSLREVAVHELFVEEASRCEHDDLLDVLGSCQVVSDLGDDH